MKKPLVDVILMSEKRKNTLLFLKDGSREMTDILKSLGTTRQALLPQIRILEDHFLVEQSNDTYELTTIGKLIVDEMTPLLDTCDLLDTDIDYWGTHNFDFIPPHLFKRINELEKCKMFSPSITEIYETIKEFHETAKKSRSVFIATTFIHPNIATLFSELLDNNANIHIIFSKELLEKLRSDPDKERIKVFDNELIHMYVYSKKMDFFSFLYNDFDIMMTPLTLNGEFDSKYLMCEGKKALEWGKELFDHFLEDSTPVNDI